MHEFVLYFKLTLDLHCDKKELTRLWMKMQAQLTTCLINTKLVFEEQHHKWSLQWDACNGSEWRKSGGYYWYINCSCVLFELLSFINDHFTVILGFNFCHGDKVVKFNVTLHRKVSKWFYHSNIPCFVSWLYY